MRRRICAEGTRSNPAMVLAEALEARRLLSGTTHAAHLAHLTHEAHIAYLARTGQAPTTATAQVRRAHRSINTDWPASPFAAALDRATIYVNQYGQATLPNQTLSSTAGYDVFFDDGGPITLTTTGVTSTDVAYYEGTGGYPQFVNDTGGRRGTTAVAGTVSGNKDLDHIAVRPHAAGTTGAFTLHVDGVPEGVPYPLSMSSKSDAGSSGSDISGTYDYDIYKFKLPRNGNYLFQVDPNGKVLDTSMNVYDNAGNPIGGTFTQPINSAGPGQIDSWTGIGLQGGQTYWLRVDGVNDQAGGYGVSVQIAPDVPDLGVTTTSATARAGRHGSLGQFTVTRSNAGPTPLTVTYRVKGTAAAGTDYSALTGTVTIPANAKSATINIAALTAPAGGRTLTLFLNAGAAYNLTDKVAATVAIAG